MVTWSSVLNALTSFSPNIKHVINLLHSPMLINEYLESVGSFRNCDIFRAFVHDLRQRKNEKDKDTIMAEQISLH